MLEQIAMGLSSLNAAKDIAKGIDSLKTSVAVNQAKIDLQNLIAEAQQGLLTAQQAEFEAAQRIRELEQKLMEFEQWEAEKQRYELADAGQGTLAYRLKAGMENGEPQHWLCAGCFQQRKKAFLQPEMRYPNRTSYLCCGTCGSEMITRGHRMPAQRGGPVSRRPIGGV